MKDNLGVEAAEETKAAKNELVCPQCGGELKKSSPECRGHCTSCEQRGI